MRPYPLLSHRLIATIHCTCGNCVNAFYWIAEFAIGDTHLLTYWFGRN